MRTAHFAALILIGLCARAAAQDAPKPATTDLIQKLSSANFREREAANQALLKRDEAIPEIRQALPVLNAEGRRRANAIIEQMLQRRSKWILQYVRDGRVDLLIDWSIMLGDRMSDEEFWPIVFDAAWNVLKNCYLAEKDNLPRSYATFLTKHPTFLRNVETFDVARHPARLAVRNEGGVEGERLVTSVITAGGPVKIRRFAMDSILLVSGDVTIQSGFNVLVIADGKVIIDVSHDVLCVAREQNSDDDHSDARYWDAPAGHLRLGDPLRGVRRTAVTSGDSVRPRSDGVRFFESIDVGLKLDERDGHVRVAEVSANSPPAKARLKPGDIIQAIDGSKADNLDAARRQLRRAFLYGGAEVVVLRGNERVSLPVSFFDWKLPAIQQTPK